MADHISAAQAVKRELDSQPWWVRRKGTLLNILQAAGWLIGVLGSAAGDWPEWAVLVLGGASYFVAAAITALTKDPFTPSMVGRVAKVDTPAWLTPSQQARAHLGSAGGENAD